MTWRQALLVTLKNRSRGDVFRAAAVAAAAAFLGSLREDPGTWPRLWVALFALSCVFDFFDDARKTRKAARVSD